MCVRILLAVCLLSVALVANALEFTATYQAPTENVDGTPLTNLDGFKVFTSASPGGPYTLLGEITDETQTTASFTYQLTSPPMTDTVTRYYVMTAYNTQGNESAYSNEIARQYTITERQVTPGAPIFINITVEFGDGDCSAQTMCTYGPPAP